MRLRDPAGFAGLWFGYDPRGARRLAAEVARDEITLSPEARQFFPRAVYVEPLAETVADLVLEVDRGEEQLTLTPKESGPLLLRARHRGVHYELAWDRVPRPLGDTVGRPTGDATEALRALGYVE